MRHVETNYSEKSTNLGHVNRGKEFPTPCDRIIILVRARGMAYKTG